MITTTGLHTISSLAQSIGATTTANKLTALFWATMHASKPVVTAAFYATLQATPIIIGVAIAISALVLTIYFIQKHNKEPSNAPVNNSPQSTPPNSPRQNSTEISQPDLSTVPTTPPNSPRQNSTEISQSDLPIPPVAPPPQSPSASSESSPRVPLYTPSRNILPFEDDSSSNSEISPQTSLSDSSSSHISEQFNKYQQENATTSTSSVNLEPKRNKEPSLNPPSTLPNSPRQTLEQNHNEPAIVVTPSFEKYVQEYNPEMDPREAAVLANLGDLFLEEVFLGKEPTNDPELQFTAITWSLMRKACEKEQGFGEGSFVILDKKGYLYNHLQKLGSYLRLSSHLAKRAKEEHTLFALQRGKDIHNHPLPNGHRTLLFAQIDPSTQQQALFLKPEKAGADPTSWECWTDHFVDYIASIPRRFQAGGNEQAGMRKERIPAEVKTRFAKLLDTYCNKKGLEDSKIHTRTPSKPKPELEGSFVKIELPNNFEVDLRDTKDTHIKKANVYGIAYVDRFLAELDRTDKVEAEEDFAQAKQAMKDFVDTYDHPSLRTGNEVILDFGLWTQIPTQTLD